jgi:hypothetical protein
MSILAPWPSHRAPSVGTQLQMCALTLKRSHRPMGRWLTCPNRLSTYNSDRCLVLSGICTCQPRLQTSHRPDGNIADELASTLACTTSADASVNNSMYVPQILENFPLPRWEFLLTCPIDSHLSIGIDLWFYQGGVRASHACKLPIAPMGEVLTRLPRLSLA